MHAPSFSGLSAGWNRSKVGWRRLTPPIKQVGRDQLEWQSEDLRFDRWRVLSLQRRGNHGDIQRLFIAPFRLRFF
jgi:hypothetical protein